MLTETVINLVDIHDRLVTSLVYCAISHWYYTSSSCGLSIALRIRRREERGRKTAFQVATLYQRETARREMLKLRTRGHWPMIMSEEHTHGEW